MRIGFGYDLHRLVPGRPLILCGVKIPHEFGLLGHSDGDAACHAVADALLGAAALGDIGHLFPDTDARFEGADSVTLLKQVVGNLSAAGYKPYNVDVMIVAERPKLAPRVPEMRKTLSAALGITVDDVSVKATTNEGLGPEGRGEAISVRAVALIVEA